MAHGQSENFNPLPPQGKTHNNVGNMQLIKRFQSTSPTGEDTRSLKNWRWNWIFQSTSPTGEDTPSLCLLPYRFAFQSTSPTGEDTGQASAACALMEISIHFPHRGRHKIRVKKQAVKKNFNPLPPQGKTPVLHILDFSIIAYFNPLPPQGKTPPY